MTIDLYRLLPAVHRNRDAEFGAPLQALMQVLGDELDAMRRDIDRLYDNWFVETCDEWVVPYIGDLLGVEGLHSGRPEVFSLRAFVANTLAYRRRKGTASVLENIAQDVSGWSVSVVEFFLLLTTAQHMNHVRMTTIWNPDDSEADRVGAVGTIDVRKTPLLARLGTAFDTASRTIDIRPFTQYDGWHNVDRLGIFVWRLRSFPMRDVVPSPLIPGEHEEREFLRFTLHPLGLSFPLFSSPIREGGATQRRREWEVPQAIERDAFNADAERYYGRERSLYIIVDGQPLDVSCVLAASLDWDEEEWQPPAPPAECDNGRWAFVDVERGRLIVETGEVTDDRVTSSMTIDPDAVAVTYHYGFSANLGGGPYGRAVTTAEEEDIIRVSKCAPIDTIRGAIEQRTSARTVIRIMDSATYEEPFIYASLADGEELVIEAADGERPTLKGWLYFEAITDTKAEVSPHAVAEPGTSLARVAREGPGQVVSPCAVAEPGSMRATARVRLSGLLVKSYVLVEGRLQVEIEHSTLMPDPERFGTATALHAFSLNYFMDIDIRHSIVGPLRISPSVRVLRVQDSVVDAALAGAEPALSEAIGGSGQVEGDTPGPETVIERSTVFGDVHVRAMPLASESIFDGRVRVERKQEGCMRYCYVDASFDTSEPLDELSRTPRRFRCQPDLALLAEDAADLDQRARTRKRLTPVFCSRTYGDPDYARLLSSGPKELREGAEDGSEMGVFSHLMEPQREANVREAVRRYLPFGLEINILYADEGETNEG